jgi:hypothetical protein
LKPARIPATKHFQTIAVLPDDVFGDCAAQMPSQSNPKRYQYRGAAAAEASGHIEV